LFRSELIKNTIFTFLLIGVIIWQFNRKEGYYNWFINDLVKSNLQFIYGDGSELTYDQKSEAKIGRSYFFLNLIKQSTPQDAIILFPNSDVFGDPSNKVKFNGFMNRKGYVSYFLYPRRVVYESEKGKNEMYNKVSHIAIVNNWGYNKLDYTVSSKIPYSVLPISQQN